MQRGKYFFFNFLVGYIEIDSRFFIGKGLFIIQELFVSRIGCSC